MIVLVRFATPLYPPKFTTNGTPAILDSIISSSEDAPLVALTIALLALIAFLKPSLIASAVLEAPLPKVNTSPLTAILCVPVAAPETLIVFFCLATTGFAAIPDGRPKVTEAVDGLIVEAPLKL